MQKELFGGAPSPVLTEPSQKSDFLQRFRISLRFDQALIVLIVLLVAYVLIFSFGVETGKRYSMAEMRAEREKRERMVEELSAKIFESQPAAPAENAATVPAAPQTEATPAVVEAAQAPVPAVNAKPAGKFTIQVVTVTSQATAERELKKFSAKGHQGFVIPSGKYLQICVDGFESRDQASQRMKQLKTTGLVPKDAYVRPFA